MTTSGRMTYFYIRKNDHQGVMAARSAFAPLFYGTHHPNYQELHLRKMLDRVQAPPSIQDDIATTESFSKSGRENGGQGAFIKSFLPPGRITADIWCRVCRKADSLKRMKETCRLTTGMTKGPVT